MLDGVLGGEEEKIDATEGGAEPFAAAIAANLANQNPEVAAETVAFLRQQTKAIKLDRTSRTGHWPDVTEPNGRVRSLVPKRI